MPRLLVIGEAAPDGSITKLSTEVATLARHLAERNGGDVEGVVVGEGSERAAGELARYLPRVAVAPALPALDDHEVALLPASPDGRDAAGILSAATGRGVLANATAVRWADEGPVVEQSVFGGRLVTESAFGDGRGIVTVRPNAVAAQPLDQPGTVAAWGAGTLDGPPAARPVERIEQAAAAVAIEDARVIVAGGRGVGGEDGFRLVQELAEALGGAVGATRAAVDSGWVSYSQQIGQTGKVVKPQLYVALGVSGAIQHKVGMQTAQTIVAINRDVDAPIAEFADLLVVGDLFEVVPALLAELRARSGGGSDGGSGTGG